MSGREEKDMADPQAAVVNSTTDQPPATNTGFLRHQYRCCTQSCHFDLKCDSDSEKKDILPGIVSGYAIGPKIIFKDLNPRS